MNLIKRLRRQFILLATVAVLIIVIGALGLINTLGYAAMRSHVIDTMTAITQNGGTLPSRIHENDTTSAGWLPIPGANSPADTPEFAYQTRYFSIHLDSENRMTSVNVKNIVAFSEDQAIAFSKTALQSPSATGFMQKNKARYGFMKTEYPDGSKLIVVMDCTRDFADFHTFLSYSIWFGFFCILLYVPIFAFLSNKAIAPFVHNLEAQKRFITNASHELKTPLAIISVNAEAIEMMNGKNDWTEGILKQVRHLSNLINHLILLSKASEMSRLQLKIEPLDVKKLLSAAASEFDLLVKDGGKKLAVSCPEGLKGMSDWKCMNELIHIFLDNAVKYCDKGGTISVSAAGTKKNVTVSVTNDYKEGEGVDYSRFFERFYRNDESHNSEKAGYGIGLSIAGELSSLLQAPLSVSYKDGKITFSITMKAG